MFEPGIRASSTAATDRRRHGIEDPISYRELRTDETVLLGTIDRSERIDAIYRIVDGALTLEEAPMDVVGWDPVELAEFVARSDQVIATGGTVLGAWDGDALVGLASLDIGGVGGDRAVVKLDLLYVSSACRGSGIGRELAERVATLARSRGATALYISATPTRRTVDFYLGIGAERVRVPDPKSFALEPEDIHLILPLTR